MATRGDHVECNGERGVICCEDPLIMRTLHFHSYVPVAEDYVVVQKGRRDDEPHAKAELVDRIRRYLEERA